MGNQKRKEFGHRQCKLASSLCLKKNLSGPPGSLELTTQVSSSTELSLNYLFIFIEV